MYALKIHAHLTMEAFKMLPFAFDNTPSESWEEVNSRAAFLSGFDPVLYNCCVNSCCLYVGPHKDLTACPFCKEQRYTSQGRPRKHFTYIPLIPRLRMLFKNKGALENLKYRGKFQPSPRRGCNRHGQSKCYCPTSVADVFDGSHYCRLLDAKVLINNLELPHHYFSDLRDIALGFSTDGFAPFKRRKHTAWPLILYNLNLPPEERFRKENIICLGVIPGPKKPHDADSFLWPMVEELIQLAAGIPIFDIDVSSMFLFHAYLIVAGGDIPAMSMIMRMKGHNGLKPCRMCEILVVRDLSNPRSKIHYVPLDRSQFPPDQFPPNTPQQYDPLHLPLRTHTTFIQQAREVQLSTTNTQEDQLSKQYGIKGLPLLACLHSLSFPTSFPYDFMHLFWANTIPNLIRHWTGEFKGLSSGRESYQINPTVWEAIGKACADSGDTIPLAYSARPMNINTDKHLFNCDMWSFWTLYLGPVLLRNRFLQPKYYTHFIDLVKLLNICLKFDITQDDLDTLHSGFARWVEQYERYYLVYIPLS